MSASVFVPRPPADRLAADLSDPRPLADIAAEVRATVAPLVDAPVTVCFADAREGAA